jgi:glutamate 5-kinase
MRVVVKIGSSSVTNEVGVIDRSAIAGVCQQTAALRAAGHEVVLVSSGAVSAGVAAVGLAARPTDLPTLQALAAAGQPRLMEVYAAELATHGLPSGQVLLVPHDFVNRRQYLHARQTLNRLLELGCVPVINENDALANDEIRYGDNDRIAALVSHLLSADVLVLLTDTPGLYTADPRTNPGAQLVERVRSDDPLLAVQVGGSGSNRGSGGMASKLAAARIASWSGVRTVIAPAGRSNVLVDAVADVETVGTVFEPHSRRLSARKLWIGFAAGVAGRLVVDRGAQAALTGRGVSLLPAGVVGVEHDFEDGDVVELVGLDGIVFARGMASIDATTARQVAGRRTSELPDDVPHEVVHRDNLVLVS